MLLLLINITAVLLMIFAVTGIKGWAVVFWIIGNLAVWLLRNARPSTFAARLATILITLSIFGMILLVVWQFSGWGFR